MSHWPAPTGVHLNAGSTWVEPRPKIFLSFFTSFLPTYIPFGLRPSAFGVTLPQSICCCSHDVLQYFSAPFLNFIHLSLSETFLFWACYFGLPCTFHSYSTSHRETSVSAFRRLDRMCPWTHPVVWYVNFGVVNISGDRGSRPKWSACRRRI